MTPCLNCGASNYFASRSTIQGVIACSECAHISAKYTPPYIKSQQQGHEKEILQPYTYSKREKGMIPNRDFIRAYGKDKLNAFGSTIQQENTRQQKNIPLNQAIKSAATK